jgi:hypothetical protein
VSNVSPRFNFLREQPNATRLEAVHFSQQVPFADGADIELHNVREPDEGIVFLPSFEVVERKREAFFAKRLARSDRRCIALDVLEQFDNAPPRIEHLEIVIQQQLARKIHPRGGIACQLIETDVEHGR